MPNDHIFDGYASDIQKKIKAGSYIEIKDDTISVSDELADAAHTHENSEVLSKLGDNGGKLTYGGKEISGVAVVNTKHDLDETAADGAVALVLNGERTVVPYAPATFEDEKGDPNAEPMGAGYVLTEDLPYRPEAFKGWVRQCFDRAVENPVYTAVASGETYSERDFRKFFRLESGEYTDVTDTLTEGEALSGLFFLAADESTKIDEDLDIFDSVCDIEDLEDWYLDVLPIVMNASSNAFSRSNVEVEVMMLTTDAAAPTYSLMLGSNYDGADLAEAVGLTGNDMVAGFVYVFEAGSYFLIIGESEAIDLGHVASGWNTVVLNGETGAISFAPVDLRTVVNLRSDEQTKLVCEPLPDEGEDSYADQLLTGLFTKTVTDDTAGLYVKKAVEGFVKVSSLVPETDVTRWNGSADKQHEHDNKALLDKLEQRGDEVVIPDTMVPLELNTPYASLMIRSDWYDVPVYLLEVHHYLELTSDPGETNPVSQVGLITIKDTQTGVPVQALYVTVGGIQYMYYLTACELGTEEYPVSREAGWYIGDELQDGEPPIVNMEFNALICGNETYTSLSGLSEKAKTALDTLSRIFNIDAESMGGLGVMENGIERLPTSLNVNRTYYFEATRSFELNLPSIIEWSPDDVQIVVYLNCLVDLDVAFPSGTRFVGGVPNTNVGMHKLICFCPKNENTWAVGGLDVEAAT